MKKSCDVLVVGSGAGGMAAALTARLHGLDVLLVEKEDLLGGGTALSFGTLWMPCNPVAARLGIADDAAAATTYLRRELGEQYDAVKVQAYLENGPRMVEYFERNTAVRFDCRMGYPDYHSEYPGASAGGRTIFVSPFDGRELGKDVARLRPPLKTATIMGMMYSPNELTYLQTFSRSWASFSYVARRFLHHCGDVLRHGRTMWLTNGNALAARLMRSAIDLGIPMITSSPMQELIVEHGRIKGARVRIQGELSDIEARRGVVLACGGFGHDIERCRELFTRPQLDGMNWSLAPEGNRGEGMRAAEAAGAQIDRDAANAGFWSPVSRVPSGAIAGHYHERQRPGFLAVTRQGKRFANEALSYHHFGAAIVQAAAPGEEPVAYLIGDHKSVRRNGCGNAVLPAPFPLGRHVRSGYLMRADTLRELAQRAGIDGDALEQTVAQFNRHAAQGKDPDFRKGESVYDRYFADPNHQPNGCLGPIEQGPFYAVRITAAHMATLAGVKADVFGRVLDAAGSPIPGLFAAGNDMSNLFGGHCPGGGITLGPGMTFGYLTGRYLAGVEPVQAEEGMTEPAPAARAA